MSYHHLSTFKRGRIEELSALGYSHRAIASRINRHRSSVDRELRRNSAKVEYKAEDAQASYHIRRKRSKPEGKWSDNLAGIIVEKLALTWSPEQIANTIALDKVSFKTIYNWLYTGKLCGIDLTVLNDYGCLHRKWPILLGISEPNHSLEELARLKAEDERMIEIEGREYTKYELSQIQRKLETAARHAKDRQIIAKAAGDDELRRQEQAKINLITSKYAKVSKASGLPTRAERLSVSKYRKVKTLEELNIDSGSFKKIKGNHSIKKDLALTNPNYTTGKDAWILNCQRCVSAYEMRRRGFDVEEMPRILNGTDKLPIMNHPEGWPTVYKGFNLIDCSSTSGINAKIKVENLMAGWGDGARSIVRVRWKGGGGHVFNAEQINGKTVFIDAQSDEANAEYYFDHIIRNNIFCMRVDNLDVTDKIKDCCKARKG